MNSQLSTIESVLRYGDWANGEMMGAAAKATDAQLDQSFDMGMNTLRKTIKHICDGELVWLARWQGKAETPWPDFDECLSLADANDRFAKTWRERDAFVSTLHDADLTKMITYRDSKGGLFKATLGDMMMQGFIHSTHHRAQAVNMLRHIGSGQVELDYIMSIRQPA